MVKLNESFKNVLTYSAGMQEWVNKSLMIKPEYTFAMDFAVADWMEGVAGVLKTYNKVKAEWLSNYKAFTEMALAVNKLSWAHDQLKKQGIDNRDPFIELYSDLYYKARDDFYARYENCKKATDYFFEMTD